jgi:hypothetical protein
VANLNEEKTFAALALLQITRVDQRIHGARAETN